MTHTRSQPRRFYELKLELGWESPDARQRLLDAIKQSSEGHIKLGTLMLRLNDAARVSFPESAVLPVLFKDIEDIEGDELPNIQVGNRVALSVKTDDASWAMDYEQGEPVRLGATTYYPDNTSQ